MTRAAPLEVLVLDHDADVYVEAIGGALTGVRAHAATTEDEALRRGGKAEVMVALAHHVSRRLIDALPRLKFIQALTTGVDHLATLNLPPEIAIASVRGFHGPQMSELALLFMLSLSRGFTAMLANQRERQWERWPQRLLLRKTLVIVGVGAIGEEVAQRAGAFGVYVVGVSESRTSAPGFDEVKPRSNLMASAGRADFLIVLSPLTSATRHMIDATVIAAMKPGAVLINLARGPVVDEAALVAALRSGHLGGAGLDVFETEPLPASSPLWAMPNVIVTPHIGGMSEVYAHQALPLVIDNLRAWQASGAADLRNRVLPQAGV